MHRFFVAALAGCIAVPAAAADRRYTITDFDRIQVEGPYQVVVTTGTASSARATGGRDAIDRVQVDVQGSMLRVRPNASAWGGDLTKQDDPLVIHLTTRTLQAARVNGSGSLAIDKVRGLKFDGGVVGSGRISVAAAEADALQLVMSGSGTIKVVGKAKTVRAEFHGSGNFEGEGLTASDAQILSDTAGTMKLGVSRSATITAGSSGEIEVTGTTACTVKQVGSGRVSCQRRR